MPHLMNDVELERKATTGFILEERRIEIRQFVFFDPLLSNQLIRSLSCPKVLFFSLDKKN